MVKTTPWKIAANPKLTMIQHIEQCDKVKNLGRGMELAYFTM